MAKQRFSLVSLSHLYQLNGRFGETALFPDIIMPPRYGSVLVVVEIIFLHHFPVLSKGSEENTYTFGHGRQVRPSCRACPVSSS